MVLRQHSRRVIRTADIGRLIAQGRRRAKLSQEQFSSRIGVSRKTLSDIERGVADHVSLRTVISALSLAGFVLEASLKRPPTLAEVMEQRAEHQSRVDRREVVMPPEASFDRTPATTAVPLRKRRR